MRFNPDTFAPKFWTTLDKDTPRTARAFREVVAAIMAAFRAILADLQAMEAAIQEVEAGMGDAIPQGAIFFYLDAACPAGYSEVVALQGRFPRGMNSGGTPGATGGSSTHDHGGATDGNEGSAYSIAFAPGGTNAQLARQTHDHDITNVNHTPPYVDGLWCQKD